MDRRAFLSTSAGVAAGMAAGAPQPREPEPERPLRALPPHHNPEGGFVNPWPTAETREPGGFLRWQRERLGQTLPPDPVPAQLPRAASEIAHPRAPFGEVRVTWVGHATFLIQAGGLNLLTDPVFGRRASPLRFLGPARFTPPGVSLAELPPLDAVLLSHDHYDHLDDGSVRRLQRAHGERLLWVTPLGYRRWFAARGARRVVELDWWQEATLGEPGAATRVVALPAQHWTSRTPWDRQQKLWASWALATPTGQRLYFGGDSGWFPEYPRLGRHAGPFDLALLPVGAYEPRWFMAAVHMNPEEAVQTYQQLGRAAWAAARLPEERLWIPRHGETRVLRRG